MLENHSINNSFRIVIFKAFTDENYSEVSIEELKNVPFVIKRVYYMFDTARFARRGYHAHKNLKQVLICIKGCCKIHIDNGFESKEILLDNPQKGLYIESMVWREMYDFSYDAVLIVVASELYDENDYVRDYQKFVEEARK